MINEQPEAHGPQRSPDCTAMKAIFSQDTVKVAGKKKWPFVCHDNLANSAVWTKFICSRNIKYCKILSNTYSQTEIKAYFHFFHYKSMETLSCHSNENT